MSFSIFLVLFCFMSYVQTMINDLGLFRKLLVTFSKIKIFSDFNWTKRVDGEAGFDGAGW